MSSKGQGGSVSEANDYYPTPAALCDWIVGLLPAWSLNDTWLEPSAGSGSFIRALARGGVDPLLIHGNEPFQEITDRTLAGTWTAEDLVRLDPPDIGGRAACCINNHPFTFWLQHTVHCHYLVKRGGLIVQLGRASVLYPQKVSAFRRRYTPMLKIGLEERVSFTDDGHSDNADHAVFIYRVGQSPPHGATPEIIASWKHHPGRDLDRIRGIMRDLMLDRPF